MTKKTPLWCGILAVVLCIAWLGVPGLPGLFAAPGIAGTWLGSTLFRALPIVVVVVLAVGSYAAIKYGTLAEFARALYLLGAALTCAGVVIVFLSWFLLLGPFFLGFLGYLLPFVGVALALVCGIVIARSGGRAE